MRSTSIAAASALALVAGGCAQHANPTARVRLDCPPRQGDLMRVSAAADGKTCGYRAGGVDVKLELLPVSVDAMSTLNRVEAALVGPGKGSAAAPSSGSPASPAPAADAADSADAQNAVRQAMEDAGGGGGDRGARWSAELGKRGGAIQTDGDNAHIDLPGLHIDTTGDSAKVDIAGLHIDAAEDEATVRVTRDVRLLGHPFTRRKGGLRATFIAKRDNLPDGYRFVGYEASGPKTGPLTVAEVRSREAIDDGDHLYRDIRRLVRRNGGA
jgi:hypothetical protein